MLIEYLNILIFAFFAFLITLVLISLNYLFIKQEPNNEKTSAYECGFEPFNFPLEQFEIKYYLVALMFLIFDLELIFILPWIMSFDYLTVNAFFIGIFFILVLTIGFLYEWWKEGLNWD